MSRRLEELADLGGLPADAVERLRGVHELLVAAGPPPELTPALARPPAAPTVAPGRRMLPRALLAAAIAAACVGAGFGIARAVDSGDELQALRVVPMTGGHDARASVRVGPEDAAGNWPIQLTVRGLPEQRDRDAYYQLFLWRDGKPELPCGGFRVEGRETTVRFTVPYRLRRNDRWVVTRLDAKTKWPGPVVMRTS